MTTALRFAAEYPRFGDPDPDFMKRVLQAAKDDGKVKDFAVHHILEDANGYSGFEIIHFTVDIEAPLDWIGLEYDETKPKAEDLLNEIVHDSDVNVRYVAPLP